MAERKTGRVVSFTHLSPSLATFRLMPESPEPFPLYKAGQYIALRREDCRLTHKVKREDGTIEWVPELDDTGNPQRGSVTHSYSISSAPFETQRDGYLEFYVVVEQRVRGARGEPGRLTESLFRMQPGVDDQLGYVNRIVGDFTLDKRIGDYENVLLVGTGTGLAPFASILKQLDHESGEGRVPKARFTLLHANRTYQELAYHETLSAMARERRFDFVYVPSVSRPTDRDRDDAALGQGRANNVLRHILGMPLKEEEDLRAAEKAGVATAAARAALEATVRPALPRTVTREDLLSRLDPPRTVILTCGNPRLMADVQHIAEAQKIRFEKEEW